MGELVLPPAEDIDTDAAAFDQLARVEAYLAEKEIRELVESGNGNSARSKFGTDAVREAMRQDRTSTRGESYAS